jgi:hypothetical protein
MSWLRGTGVVLLVAFGAALVAGLYWLGHRPPTASGPPRPPRAAFAAGEAGAARAAAVEAPEVAVLARWDARRAAAYARGDVAALRRLYVARSPAGTADAAVLLGYRRRGLRVTGMRMQLLSVEVLTTGADRLRLRVVDRLAHAVSVGRGSRTLLPRDRASTHVVSLRRGPDARWRVVSVTAAPGP